MPCDVAMTGLPNALLELISDEQLKRVSSPEGVGAALALRSRIVLACATGLTNKEVAARLGSGRPSGVGGAAMDQYRRHHDHCSLRRRDRLGALGGSGAQATAIGTAARTTYTDFQSPVDLH